MVHSRQPNTSVITTKPDQLITVTVRPVLRPREVIWSCNIETSGLVTGPQGNEKLGRRGEDLDGPVPS